MIEVSRLNGKTFVINCELIKFVEATPDTVITLSGPAGDEKLMVQEPVAEVVRRVTEYRRRLRGAAPCEASSARGAVR